MRGPEIRPLTHVRFPKQDCAGVAEFFCNESVVQCNRSLESQRSGRRCHAIGGIDVVLEKNRNSVQRTARSSRGALTIEGVRNRKRIRIDLQNVMQRWSFLVERIDSLDVLLRYRSCSSTPSCHVALQILNRDFLEIEYQVAIICATCLRRTRTDHQGGAAEGPVTNEVTTPHQPM